MKCRVESEFRKAIRGSFPEMDDDNIKVSTSDPKFGDYQCNNAMSIFKTLGKEKAGSPKSVADKIKDLLSMELFESVMVAPQGFITVKMSEKNLVDEISKVFENGITYKIDKPKSVLVDYSSPNIAKEMHVGHLRSTIQGESICRVLEFVGHKVLRVNHLGDWGTQFGMLICHLEETCPNYQIDQPDLSDLNQFYREAKTRFDKEEGFAEEARKRVVQLQSGDPKALAAWNLLVRVSLDAFQKIYDRFDVKLVNRGESFYNDMIPGVLELCEKAGIVEVADGAKCIFNGQEGDSPLIVVKSDGGYGYASTDMAAIYYRFDNFVICFLFVWQIESREPRLGSLYNGCWSIGPLRKII